MSKIREMAGTLIIVVILSLVLGWLTSRALIKPQAFEVQVEKIVKETVEVPTTEYVTTKYLDPTPRRGIMSAFGAEMAIYLSEIVIEDEYVLGGHTWVVGRLWGHDVVLVISGVSMEPAAVSTALLLTDFNVTDAIYSGIAGGVDEGIRIGDVAIPGSWALYQKALFAREMPDGTWGLGWHSDDYPNFGMSFPQDISIFTVDGEVDKTTSKFWFDVDTKMYQEFQTIADTITLAKCTDEGVCLDFQPRVKVGGTGVSGPTFVDNAAFREYTNSFAPHDEFGLVQVLDMETASFMMVCDMFDTPCIAIRSASDLAGGGEGENLIGTYFKLAADNSAKVMRAWLDYTATGILPEPPELVFGCIYVGPYNDHGWSEAHHMACQHVTEEVPGTSLIFLDKVNPADRSDVTLEQIVDDMVAEGTKLIFTTSDDFGEDTILVAQKYPGVTFIHISGNSVRTGKAPSNLGNYMGRMEDMKAAAGCAAALKTETGTIGYVGPLINDETRRLVAAAYLGAKRCYTGDNPLRFIVNWIGFWFHIPGVTLDPTEVSNGLFNEGADVILSGIDTTEALIVANQRGKLAIPYDYENACDEALDVCLGVPYFDWKPGYTQIAKQVIGGTWEQHWTWAGYNDDAVGWVHGSALDEGSRAIIDKLIADIAAGEVTVFVGPLNFQDGSVYLKDGEVATDDQIWHFPQLLEGMEGLSE